MACITEVVVHNGTIQTIEIRESNAVVETYYDRGTWFKVFNDSVRDLDAVTMLHARDGRVMGVEYVEGMWFVYVYDARYERRHYGM